MTDRNKTIVMSDIHISNGAGYTWFLSPYPEYLIEMLNNTASDETVAELVLMGDVFDLWLFPVDMVPLAVCQILQENLDILEALRGCVANIPSVYYMNGNHDIKVTEKDLQWLSAGGKNMQLVTPEWYNSYSGNRIHLEHGHAVDMFNAPDNSSDSIGAYPLGFFISRMVASAADQKKGRQAVLGVLDEFRLKIEKRGLVDERWLGSWLVRSIIRALQDHTGIPDGKRIMFTEPELNNRYTVEDVKGHYGDLLGTWHRKYPDVSDLLNSMLTSLLPNGLDWYAKKLLSPGKKPRILIMGHTHYPKKENEYINDGCWCNAGSFGNMDKTPTYVEIVGDVPTLCHWKS